MLAWTFDTKISESEFLRREFGIKLKKINKKEISRILQKRSILLVSIQIKELELIFQKARNSQITLIWLGNETYNIKEYDFLEKYSSKIKKAFIYNLPNEFSCLSMLFSWLGGIFDGGLFFRASSGNYFRTWKNGLDLLIRTKNLKIGHKLKSFPQGYTKNFSKEFSKKFRLSINKSLINYRISENYSIQQPKVFQVVFFGGTGSWCRNLAISKLRRSKTTHKIVINSGWSNSSSQKSVDYLEITSASEFTLCPPGNVTNKTFRHLESLLLCSIPISLPVSMQDPHHWESLFSKKNPLNYSWRFLLFRTTLFSENKKLLFIKKGIDKEKSKIIKIVRYLENVEVAGAGIEPAT